MALDKIESAGMEKMGTSMPSQKLSDHDLIEATKSGDEAAFGEIMNRYRNPLTNYLYRFLNDYEEAVDLAQETFLALLHQPPATGMGATLIAWLCRVPLLFSALSTRRGYARRSQ